MKVQARITLPMELRRDIDRLRAVWNPERATGNPAHVTIVYHDEAPDPSMLAERLRLVAATTMPFRLSLGRAERFADTTGGAFLTVGDPSGGIAAIRTAVLTAPFTMRDRFGLHVTLLHPDQGHRTPSAWPALDSLPPAGTFEVAELQLVGPDNAILAVFPLGRNADTSPE